MIEIIKTKDEINEFLKVLDKRNSIDQGIYVERVNAIIEDIKENRDEALIKYTKMFDDKNASLDNLVVDRSEMKKAYDLLDEDLKDVISTSASRIRRYHEEQIRKTWVKEFDEGEIMGQKITPLQSVGVYVPGGKASYPSTVLMDVIPAKVANVKNIVMVTPAINGQIRKEVLAAAYIAGVDKIIKIGGAQAIASLTYGTNIVPKVDKIVGPGNIYVALAKKMCFGKVGIDSIAGPSEILILADDTANPKYVACDLMGQAEHDELASGIMITTSLDLAYKVKEEIEEEYKTCLRQNILEKSLTNYCKLIVVDNEEEMFELANIIAPEHLELEINDAYNKIDKVINAGAIFVGSYTPEALGDYMAGPNHTLPTAKTSRFFSPLSVDDFIKKSSILYFSQDALNKLSDKIVKFADSEGLQMHGESIKVRQK